MPASGRSTRGSDGARVVEGWTVGGQVELRVRSAEAKLARNAAVLQIGAGEKEGRSGGPTGWRPIEAPGNWRQCVRVSQ